MAVKHATLGSAFLAGTGLTQIYALPDANHEAQFSITVCNTLASAVTVSIWVAPSGTQTNGDRKFSSVSIPGNTSVFLSNNFALSGGDGVGAVFAQAGTGGALDVAVEGREYDI